MRKKVLLDTNLSILLCVGLTKRSYIRKHKALQAFTEADFDLLVEHLEAASHIIISPNIATETSNLSRQIGEPIRSEISAVLAAMMQEWDEVYIPSRDASTRVEFRWLGLTDAAILDVLKDDTVLLTTDHNLHVAAVNANLQAYNFNHVREERFGL